jgi:hypothetical protein
MVPEAAICSLRSAAYHYGSHNVSAILLYLRSWLQSHILGCYWTETKLVSPLGHLRTRTLLFPAEDCRVTEKKIRIKYRMFRSVLITF